MPRIFRVLPETGIFHILGRGNNQQAIFKDTQDYEHYLFFLRRFKDEHKFLLYHYCLMSNHVHLVLETTNQTNLSKLMKQINLCYYHHFSKKYEYCGHFWQGRYKSIIVDRDRYLVACGRYIELNPVRAKMVNGPEEYPWSSYKFYAYGKSDSLLDINPLYQEMGKSDSERQTYYRQFTEDGIITNLNLRYLGSQEFVRIMEEQHEVKNLRDKRGRPRKVRGEK